MNISYIDHGVTASLTLTSWLPHVRQHNRCVDAVLLRIGSVQVKNKGFIRRATVITGRTPLIMHAYKVVLAEVKR
ncbi:hypothetical protein NUG10_003465 [Yersinia enterocolitica]|uniref:hypothetical protein n=1 Tax=Yersinia enterocolitica TaxID=630 RepID=UPI002858BA49|nr:hypothetical protein [Yersinia enterocolitica]EKN3873770.1 hypothetical protein [Yersinia enterocolitica]HDL6629365.1 hypothetical protein [Yersinia enterocolitica]HDL6656410.1 hypothetical protein [Yersinia enterocolitica]HDL6681810.1 hypothetical protein [Yersinia enterocolitica]